MEVKFNNKYLEKLYFSDKLKIKSVYSIEVIEQFRKKILLLKQTENTVKLRHYKGLNFEALKGDKKGLYSIRVNKQYRIEFTIEKEIITLLEIIFIEDLSKHYE